MVRLVVATLLAFAAFPAWGDTVLLETSNNPAESVQLLWSGKLIGIDSATQIANFEFLERNTRGGFSVHVTRIKSLEFDDNDRVNREFPPTRAELTSPLKSDPNKIRYVEISNVDGITDRLPPKAAVKPNRKSPKLTLWGEIYSVTERECTLKIRDQDNRTEHSITIPRDDLLKWIRNN